MNVSRIDLTAVLMGLAFSFMWSSAFASARIIVADAPPLTALAVRFWLSGALGMGLALAMGQRLQLTGPQARATVVFGLCQNALYLGFYFVAMQRIEAGLASIIASTMPLIVAAAGIVQGHRPRALGVAGLAAGFAGVVLIMGTRLSGGVDAAGLVYCGLGVAALSFATLAVRGASAGGGNLLMIVGLQMWVGAAALTVAAAVLEWPGGVAVDWSVRLGLAFLYTMLVPGLMATWLWFRLVGRIGALRAATFHFLNPFFGVLTGAVVLGEVLGPWDAVGVAVVAAGILAVQLSRARSA